MAARPIQSQGELDQIIEAGGGWLFNRYYHKLHHASCETFRWGSQPSFANFRHLFETWADAESHDGDRCPVCKPGPYQRAFGGTARRERQKSAATRVASPTPPTHGRRLVDAPVPSEAIREFVEQIERSREADMSFRADPALAPLPNCALGAGLSHYLLLAAAIDVGVNSNDIRPFLCALDSALGDRRRERGLFDLGLREGALAMGVIQREQASGRLRSWQAKQHVPRILAEANDFVRDVAAGDLDGWSKRSKAPAEVVSRLTTQIYYQGAGNTETRKKMWMLMRWLVRPSPDLRLWDHFDPAELMVPVDRHVARFAHTAGFLRELPMDGPFWPQVVEITGFARKLFPEDPARVDYSFFMWGRGRTRPLGDSDTCHTLFRAQGLQCPLASLMPCSAPCSAT